LDLIQVDFVVGEDAFGVDELLGHVAGADFFVAFVGADEILFLDGLTGADEWLGC